MEPVPDDVAAKAGPPPRRRRVVAVALIIALACALVVWWGRPRLGHGGMLALGDGMTWANDGVENTRMLVRGRPVATATAKFSIRNDGHLPFTVHGLDTSQWAGDWLTKQKATFVPGFPGEEKTAAPVGQVTLGPGDEATVLWSLDMHCQPPMSEGQSMGIGALRFRVSWWGISTARELPLEQPITFVGDNTSQRLPGQECASD